MTPRCTRKCLENPGGLADLDQCKQNTGYKTQVAYSRDTIVSEVNRSRVSRNSLNSIPLNEFSVKGHVSP
ncbi:MAG TPA: hypothetical protein VE177_06395 [Candidatus Binatus sp.]|nr:hypothetical protein [Candidatus Binatus sp.]